MKIGNKRHLRKNGTQGNGSVYGGEFGGRSCTDKEI